MFEENLEKESKQKEQLQYLVIAFLAGVGYYFFIYLNNKREKAKKEINKLFQQNSAIATADLDATLWNNKENWEEHLDSLYLGSQINLFVREMKKTIEEKQKELEKQTKERKKQAREKAITEIEKICSDAFGDMIENLPSVQKAIKTFTKKVNKSSIDDLSLVIEEAQKFLYNERNKIKRLYWDVTDYNWADRWLKRNKESFVTAWKKMKSNLGEEPPYFDAKAIYRINFPPSLWGELTPDQKKLAKENGHDELILKDEVQSYKFSEVITEWMDKVINNPVRGEQNTKSNELDNNAIFYGAPRTGKSIMAEKLAYEADVYPLVTIQGSTLTPRKIDTDASVTLLLKFIFTISSITHDLVNNYGFERAEGDGEARYILFIDEADQICTNNFDPPRISSSQLTFLKECMGSDNKLEESKNLWIAATNHLDNVNVAVYQSGRLSNRLCFSWTLGDFIKYADNAGISSQFPQRWIEEATLNDEDNQWVNKFNNIIFKNEFLPFWNKFIIANPNAEYEPEKNEEEQEIDNQDDQNNNKKKESKQKKIKWGEMFEFFWRLKNSSQLEHFEGKFINPRQQKIEDAIKESAILSANQISKSIDTRLKDIWKSIGNIEEETKVANTTFSENLNKAVEQITGLLSEIGGNMK